jgi:hypothetical protein
LVFEVNGASLERLNGKRGYVHTKLGKKSKVCIDDEQMYLKNDKLYPVFCLGLRHEYWVTDDCSEEQMKGLCQSKIGSSSSNFRIHVCSKRSASLHSVGERNSPKGENLCTG